MTKTLRQTISKLVASYSPVAVEQQSFFLNSIVSEIPVEENAEIIHNLLNSLFYCVARSTSESCIRVSAACGSEVTEIVISTNSAPANYSFIRKFEHLKILAAKIGGMLEVTGREQTKIIFSFLNPIKQKPAVRPAFHELLQMC